MSWTDDRVSLLTKLWGEGHTAAEIAEKLGGVTRNAVIGKAHRLKLSNRVSPIQQNKTAASLPKPANKNEARKAEAPQKLKSVALKRSNSNNEVYKEPVMRKEDLYSLADLMPRMCRWPCGDPRDDDFGFCGDSAMAGLPYCAAHAKVAYQAATRNRIFKEEKKAVVSDDQAVEGRSKKASA